MTGTDSGTWVDVPEQCFVVKDWFTDLPDLAKRKEIKAFIEMTGRPFMWPGHTHTHPPDGSIPVYLDEFEIPRRFKRNGRLAPCPCCCPRHAKYAEGRIAWFPTERLIRLIGHRCFRSLNKDAHENAEAEMRQRKKTESDIAYLLKNHDRLKQAYEVCVSAKPVAEAIQALSKALRRTFEQSLDLPIWQHIRHGTLPIWQEFNEVTGDGHIQARVGSRSYAAITGHRMLAPNLKNYPLRLDQVANGFKTAFETDDWNSFVVSLSDRERHQLAKLVNSSVGTGRDLFAEMRELQGFTSHLNIATIRTWGRHEDNPIPLVFERDDMTLRIGKNDYGKIQVRIPAAFESQLFEIDLPLIKEFGGE